jgi:hypothetical protein
MEEKIQNELKKFYKTLENHQYSEVFKTQARTGLESMFRFPPSEGMTRVLGKTVNPVEARRLLFYPKVEDFKFYPAFLGCGEEKVTKDSLVAFFILHSHGPWTAVRTFIVAGFYCLSIFIC